MIDVKVTVDSITIKDDIKIRFSGELEQFAGCGDELLQKAKTIVRFVIDNSIVQHAALSEVKLSDPVCLVVSVDKANVEKDLREHLIFLARRDVTLTLYNPNLKFGDPSFSATLTKKGADNADALLEDQAARMQTQIAPEPEVDVQDAAAEEVVPAKETGENPLAGLGYFGFDPIPVNTPVNIDDAVTGEALAAVIAAGTLIKHRQAIVLYRVVSVDAPTGEIGLAYADQPGRQTLTVKMKDLAHYCLVTLAEEAGE